MAPAGVNMTSESLSRDCPNCTRPSTPELNVAKAVALGLVLGIFIVFGVLGNLLVILSVACHRHLRTVTHFFIVNLAVADLLLSSTVLPFSAAFEILGRWVFGRTFCNAWAAMDVLCCTASIMSLCAISVDRCIGVSYPLRYPAIVTRRRGLLALGALWALAGAISVGPLVGWRGPVPEDDSVCGVTEEPGYAVFSAVGSFYAPLAIILAMYCRVYAVARRESRGLREGRKTDPSDSGGVTLRMHRGHPADPPADPPGEGGRGEEALRGRTHFTLRLLKLSREKKAAKTLGIVVGCFVLCWLPFFLVLPIGSIFPSLRPSEAVFKITFWLGYFNSCINPIIYPCFSQEFKKAFQNVLRARCLGRKARHPSQPHPEGRQHTEGHLDPEGHPHPEGHLDPEGHQHPEGHQDPGGHRPPESHLDLEGHPHLEGPPLHLSSSPPAPPLTTSQMPPPCRRWGGFIGTPPSGAGGAMGGAEVARVCSKSLLRACCWAAEDAPVLHRACSCLPDNGALPVVKVHQLFACEGGEAV